MRTYLATLHKRSDRHKKNFALAVSGGFTLIIFAIWCAVNFGAPAVVADNVPASPIRTLASDSPVPDVTPFQAAAASLSGSWQALKDSFNNATSYGR